MWCNSTKRWIIINWFN